MSDHQDNTHLGLKGGKVLNNFIFRYKIILKDIYHLCLFVNHCIKSFEWLKKRRGSLGISEASVALTFFVSGVVGAGFTRTTYQAVCGANLLEQSCHGAAVKGGEITVGAI